MKKIIALVALVAVVAGVFFATARQSEGEETEETVTLRLSEVTHSVFYAPQYVALELGFFRDEGLEVELINGGGADKVMVSVLTGEAEIGLAGPEACIYTLLEGREDAPRIFAQLTNCDGSFLVGRTEEDFSWENLRGKTIIGGRKGGVPEMTLEYTMKKNGITPHVDATVDTSVQFNMMAGAFTSGNGDYVTLFEPTATEVELAGQGHILCAIGEESGEIPYTAYFAAGSYIDEHSDVIQRFTNAVARGQQWVAQHSDAEVAQALVTAFPDTDVEILTTVVGRYRSIAAWCTVPAMKQEALERLETVMEQAGELTQRVEFTELVENRFAEEAAW